MFLQEVVFSKLIFWGVLCVGLILPIAILLTSFSARLPREHQEKEAIGLNSDQYVYTHHVGLRIGPLKFKFSPRPWATFLGIIGLILLVSGLIVLLHVEGRSHLDPNISSEVDLER